MKAHSGSKYKAESEKWKAKTKIAMSFAAVFAFQKANKQKKATGDWDLGYTGPGRQS